MDFLMSDSGDLLFKEPDQYNKLKLSFKVRSNALRLSFKTPKEEHEDPVVKNKLKVSFSTSQEVPVYTSETEDISELDRQRLLIALRTEQGELADRGWLGSNLQKVKHLQIRKESFLKKVEEDVKKAIDHIIPNAKVVAKREYINNNYGTNNVTINIYNNNILIFKFYM